MCTLLKNLLCLNMQWHATISFPRIFYSMAIIFQVLPHFQTHPAAFYARCPPCRLRRATGCAFVVGNRGPIFPGKSIGKYTKTHRNMGTYEKTRKTYWTICIHGKFPMFLEWWCLWIKVCSPPVLMIFRIFEQGRIAIFWTSFPNVHHCPIYSPR